MNNIFKYQVLIIVFGGILFFYLFNFLPVSEKHNASLKMPSRSASSDRKKRRTPVCKGGHFIFIHCPETGKWQKRIKKHPKYPTLGDVRWLKAPVCIKTPQGTAGPAYFGFLKKLHGMLRSVRGVEPSKWKVVFTFNHGAKTGKVGFHPRIGEGPRYDPRAPDWFTAQQWFQPLYSLGIRHLHFHTCWIGSVLKAMKKEGGRGDAQLMTVTGWNTYIWEYVDSLETMTNDDYVLQGLPVVSSMRSRGARSFASIWQVGINSEGKKVREDGCVRQR